MANSISPREFTGRHMAIIMVLFFGTITAVNIYMATSASRSWTGLVVKNSYVASQKFNDNAKKARKQNALGYKGALSYSQGKLNFAVTDKKQMPASLSNIRIKLGRPTHVLRDTEVALAREKKGVFSAPHRLDDGSWQFQVLGDLNSAETGLKVWKMNYRFLIKDGKMVK